MARLRESSGFQMSWGTDLEIFLYKKNIIFLPHSFKSDTLEIQQHGCVKYKKVQLSSLPQVLSSIMIVFLHIYIFCLTDFYKNGIILCALSCTFCQDTIS